MAIKKLNPITPGTRQRVQVLHPEITASKPNKGLTEGLKKSGGRNNEGHRTVRNRGGGHKRRYRIIDFKRDKDGIPATVLTIEYDPNRSCYIALLEYQDGEKRYILAPRDLKPEMVIESGRNIAPEIGNAMPLEDMPIGTVVFAIELQPGHGAAMARSAGTSAQLVGREGKYAIIKLPSGEMRRVLQACRATVGTASNQDHNLAVLGKAGRNRWLGRRPRVRGVAMNPVDHPMGGGEGRASGGHPRSRGGIMAKGQKTRNPKKHSNKHIISRKNAKK